MIHIENYVPSSVKKVNFQDLYFPSELSVGREGR